MRKLFLLGIMAIVLSCSVGVAYAQTTEPSDSVVIIVLSASVLSALAVPIIGYATQKQTDPDTKISFDWSQYAIAIVINIPVTAAFTLGQLQVLNLTIIGLYSVVFLFIQVFMNGLAVDYVKSRVSRAIKN